MLGEITYNPSEETIYPIKQINVEMDDNDTEDIHTDDTDPGSEPDSAPPADSSGGGGSAGPGGGY